MTYPRRSALIRAMAAATGPWFARHVQAATPSPHALGASALRVPTARSFEGFAKEMVSRGETDGLAVVIVRKGLVDYCTAGVGARDSSSVVTIDSAFEIGSISKVFSAQVLAHAVHASRIDLQADIRKYLSGSFPNLAFEGKPIEVRHLVDTTSALPDNLPESDVLLKGHPAESHFDVISKHVAEDSYARLLGDLHGVLLRGPSGRRPAHSNLAAQLLGAILSRAYGERYGALLNRFIERPFGMSPSGLHRQRMGTVGYLSKTSAASPYLQGETMLSAGGLAYSARDMGLFLKGHLRPPDPALKLARKVLWGDANDVALGFGWQVSKTPDGVLRYRASGGTLGYSSYIEMYPQLGYGVALLSNRAGDAQSHLKWIAEQGKDRLFGKPAALLAFERLLQDNRFANIAEAADRVQRQYPAFHLSQDLLDTWAFGLIMEGQKFEGLALLAFQSIRRPRSPTAVLAYAEGMVAVGQLDQAIGLFQRVLELEPGNQQATGRLRDLGGQR